METKESPALAPILNIGKYRAIRPGLILISTGCFVGLAASIAVTHLMSDLLFGVSASDPLTFAIVPMLLGIVALVACFIPARYCRARFPAQTLSPN